MAVTALIILPYPFIHEFCHLNTRIDLTRCEETRMASRAKKCCLRAHGYHATSSNKVPRND